MGNSDSNTKEMKGPLELLVPENVDALVRDIMKTSFNGRKLKYIPLGLISSAGNVSP